MIKRPADRHLLAWAGLIILVCLYPIATFEHSLKWDAIDITLPWRYFSCDALRQGILPLWNPFQFQGFAHGTEPQTWYPLALLFGLPAGYSAYSLNLEFLAHLLIALWGFSRLAKVNNISSSAAAVAGLSFALSGFFIGNSQHFGWIVAAAWLPHVVASYQQLLFHPSWKPLIPLALSCFLLGTGGYIAFAIILAYILMGMSLYGVAVASPGHRRQLFAKGLALMLAVAALCGLVMVGWWDLVQHISRADGLKGEEALVGSSYFKHLLSLMWPASTVHQNWEFWQADQSLINHYIGVPTLVFAFSTLGRFKQNAFVRRLWILLTLALLLSMGRELPLRSWANLLPGFSLFRFPSIFRYFTILLLCLLAAKGLDELVRDRSPVLLVRTILVVAVGYFVGGLLTADAGLGLHSLESSLYTGSIIGLGLLLSTYLLWISTSKIVQRHLIILGLVAIDLFAFIQLNGPVSLLSSKSFSSIQATMSALPQGYPHPPLQDALLSNPDKSLQEGAVYRNTNTLYKRIGWDGYTPYQYRGFLDMEESSRYRSTLLAGPLMLAPLRPPAPGHDYHEVKNDLELIEDCLDVVDFSPNGIIVKTQTAHSRLMVYNQNHHPKWKAYVDDREVPIYRAEINLMAIHLPAGDHEVRFVFWPGSLVNALYISGTLFCILLLVFLLRHQHRWSLAVALLVFASISLLRLQTNRKDDGMPTTQALYNEYHEIFENTLIRDRFLDRGDLDRFTQLRHNNPEIPYYSNAPTAISDRLNDSIPSFTSLCTFGCGAHGWQRDLINIDYDDVLNTYQDHTDLEYGATYEHHFSSGGSKRIQIHVDVRGEAPAAALLVVTLERAGNNLAWGSYSLAHTGETWTRRNFTQLVDIDPGTLLKVYVWNPKLASFGIDNLSIGLEDAGQ